MANILTAAESANTLRCESNDPIMLGLLAGIDDYIKNGTGRDWAMDTPIHPQAKNAARMLLVRLYEDPGAMAAGNALGFGLNAVMVQLKTIALELAQNGVPMEALGLISTNIAGEMAVNANLVLVFNHAMAASAISSVSVETAAGAAVAVTNSLDGPLKILTVNPDASLAADTSYVIKITAAADAYGQTLTAEIRFETA